MSWLKTTNKVDGCECCAVGTINYSKARRSMERTVPALVGGEIWSAHIKALLEEKVDSLERWTRNSKRLYERRAILIRNVLF
jgi:hypothetical protein